MLGRIKTSPNKFGGPDKPALIHTNEVTEGLRNACNMCHGCANFKPDSQNNCEIAESLFKLGREKTIATMVTRCGQFVPKANREAQQ